MMPTWLRYSTSRCRNVVVMLVVVIADLQNGFALMCGLASTNALMKSLASFINPEGTHREAESRDLRIFFDPVGGF